MRNICLVMLMVLPCLAGCLNPDIVSTTVGGLYPTAPGNEQFVLVRLINQTTATLDVPIKVGLSRPGFAFAGAVSVKRTCVSLAGITAALADQPSDRCRFHHVVAVASVEYQGLIAACPDSLYQVPAYEAAAACY